MSKRKLDLTPRLRLLADWVTPGACVADIGTDHGHLPIWLVREGLARHAVACDLRPGPLSRAVENAAAYGVSEQMDFRLCDGLSGVSPSEADTILIAGMGGENIAEILRAAPWTADGAHRLLLQPMSRAEVLRRFLAEHGYAIVREQLVLDRGTLYPVLLAEAGSMQLSLGQLWGGAALGRDPLENRYLIEKILQMQIAVAGKNQSLTSEAHADADRLREILTGLMELREEWRNANS